MNDDSTEIKSENGDSSSLNMGKKSLVDAIVPKPKLIWNKKVKGTQLSKFQQDIETKYQVKFSSYWDLHKWTVENYDKFWEETWRFYGVVNSTPYEEVVRSGKNLLDVEWFPGARFNYAENMLKFRDDHVALICLDEEGTEEKITYSEMYEEVKLYAAAFKKHGLKKGDRIACYMSNRKEAIFAMLAGASIGALWGGPLPMYGPKAASNIICAMSPKFLFTVDRFRMDSVEKNIFKNLPDIVKGICSLEKVIVVPSKDQSLSLDLSAVEKSCFLHEFLAVGKSPDGIIPDLTFEQLPFNHPLFITFTSGTTGSPKGLVHSAGVFLPILKDLGLHYNFCRDDVIFSISPVGWSVWNRYVHVLSLGATLLLFAGWPFFLSPHAFWDITEKYKVTYTFFPTEIVDKMEKKNVVPSPGCKLENLKMVKIGASPIKPQNFEYLLEKVKKDMFVVCSYGATEFITTFSGSDYNSPAYAAMIQCPALGVDMRCFDDHGNSVVGQKGEMVIATPNPSFPISIWNDNSKNRLQELYLSKYPGVWGQNDLCWVDPKTHGLKVLGRSDEALNPAGSIFGSAEVYLAIHNIKEIFDSLCVPQYNASADQRVILFVKMAEGSKFTPDFAEKVRNHIIEELTHTHVIEVVLEAPDIPYNLNNKKMERLVMKIIMENKVPDVVTNIKNPESLEFFCNIPELQNY